MTIAVCIPAAGSAPDLEQTIGSIRSARGGDDAHVIVAIDGPDPILEVAARRIADDVIVLDRNRGSYAARNAAIAALPASVATVLFTDSGLEVGEGWIQAHEQGLSAADRSGGPVRCITGEPPSAVEWVDAHRHFRQHHNVTTLGFSVTANLGVRRQVVQRLTFDERLRSGGDFEFGQRATAAGFTIGWAEDAWVAHPARTTLRALLTKVDRVGRGSAVLRGLGHAPEARRVATGALRRPLAAARSSERASDRLWVLQVAVVDLLCSLVLARHQPRAAVTGALARVRRAIGTHERLLD